MSLAARVEMLGVVSGDMKNFLLPWTDYISEHGVINSLRNGVPGANYPPIYMLILSLFTLIPTNMVFLIKLFSLIFDFVCALTAFFIVWEFRKDILAFIAYGAVLLSPTVILNSARWGQCDSIYTAFILLCVYFFIKNKRVLPGIMFGIALAFKLQTVFFLPAFIYIYFKRERGFIVPFGAPAAGLILANIPPLIFGSPIKNVVSIYFMQTSSSQSDSLTCGAFPNLYYLIHKATDMSNAIIFFAMGIILLIFLLLWEKLRFDAPVQNHVIIAVTMLSLLIVPFVLPHMHERYYYPADIFSIIFAAVFLKRYAALPVVVTMLSLLSYFPYLFGETLFDNAYLGIIMLAVIVFIGRGFIKGHFYPKTAYINNNSVN